LDNKIKFIGYITILIVYSIISARYPYLNFQHQRELLLGAGEMPWGTFFLGFILILYHFILPVEK